MSDVYEHYESEKYRCRKGLLGASEASIFISKPRGMMSTQGSKGTEAFSSGGACQRTYTMVAASLGM